MFSNLTGIRTDIVGMDKHIKLLFDEVKNKKLPIYLHIKPQPPNPI